MNERDFYTHIYVRTNGMVRLCQLLGLPVEQIQPGLRETREAALSIVLKHASREEFGLPFDAPDADVERKLTERLHMPSEAQARKLRAELLETADIDTLQAIVGGGGLLDWSRIEV